MRLIWIRYCILDNITEGYSSNIASTVMVVVIMLLLVCSCQE